MALLFQVVALPVALHFASLSDLAGPRVGRAEIREACRQLLPEQCPQTNVEAAKQCKEFRTVCKRLAKTTKPCLQRVSHQDAEICQAAMALAQTATMATSANKALQEACAGLCHKESLRELVDSSIHLKVIKDLQQGHYAMPKIVEGRLEPARAYLDSVLDVYEAAVENALGRGCWFAHGFALLASIARVQLILLLVGLVQDLCSCLVWCLRKAVLRLLQPALELMGCAVGAFNAWRLPERLLEPSAVMVLPAEPAPMLSSTVRSRTRLALQAMASNVEPRTLARMGLKPSDVQRHAAELDHIQSKCFPMRAESAGWWLAREGVATESAEVEALALSIAPGLNMHDCIRFAGVVLPLPSVVLLVEHCQGNLKAPIQLPVIIGALGLCCTGMSGLLENQPQRWHPVLVQLLSAASAILGAACAMMDCEHVVLSTALLASVNVHAGSHVAGQRGRALLASSFAAFHLLGAACKAGHGSLGNVSLAELDWAFLSEKLLQTQASLGYLASATSILLLRGLPQSKRPTAATLMTAASLVLMTSAVALLLSSSTSGLVVALWWLASCEVLAAVFSNVSQALVLPEDCSVEHPKSDCLHRFLLPGWRRASRGGA